MADYTEIAICICERFTMVACVFGTIDNYILCLINTTRKHQEVHLSHTHIVSLSGRTNQEIYRDTMKENDLTPLLL